MNIVAFDIETIPDISAGRRLLQLPKSHSDEEVAQAMQVKSQEARGTDFLPIHWHGIACISLLLWDGVSYKVWTLGLDQYSEAEIVERFFAGIAKLTPTLVSWNGSGFDLPVLHYRSLVHGVDASRYWELGERDNQFKWNNYISRYHMRHIDAMDLIASYQPRCFAPLDELAVILGFPGKLGMSGSKVWETYCNGDIQAICDYCETDVLNTFLVYLRFEQVRGHLNAGEYEDCQNQLRQMLKTADKKHFNEFLANWPENKKVENHV